MQAYFKWERFLGLLKSQWIERKASFFSFTLVCVILYGIIIMPIALTSGGALNAQNQSFIYYAGLMIVGYVFAIRFYEPLNKKNKQMLLLMYPASMVEKWLAMMFVVLLFFPVLFSLVITLCNLVLGYLSIIIYGASSSASEGDGQFSLFIPLFDLFNPKGAYGWVVYWMYVVIQGLIMLLSCLYKRAVNIKIFVTILILNVLTPINLGVISSGGDYLFNVQQKFDLTLFHWAMRVLAWFVVPLLLWLSAYYFLKNREAV